MKNLAICIEEFGYLEHVMPADYRNDKDIKKQFRKKDAIGNMLVRKFSFAHIEGKIKIFKSYCYPIYGCALWRHSSQNSIRKLTVSFCDTFKSLINVPRYTSSSLAFAMSATDHINVVFRKFAYSLMSSFPQQYCYCMPLSTAMHVSSFHWWINKRVCYMYMNNYR